MGKYSHFERQAFRRPWQVHPIWRGFGCIMIIVIPIMSVAGAIKLVEVGVAHGWPIPSELLGRVLLPEWAWNLSVFADIARAIYSVNNLLAILVFSIILLILLFAIFSTLYAYLYRIIGPPRYTIVDAPPPKRRGKPYKR